MDISELRDLDFNDLGSASGGVKAIILLLVAALILGLGYYFKISDQRAQLERVEREESQLRREFEEKQEKAANLEAYEEQLEEMQELLQVMLRQLPSRTEMPDLLVDVSQTALAAGIDNELFEPRGEVVRDFYAERPINLRMVGDYHQFGTFVSGVASLPRVVILTMNDISLQPTGDGNRLRMEGVVTTYRYLDEFETEGGTGGSQ